MHKWSFSEIEFLKKHYPNKGKKWCCQKLNKTDSQIRAKASDLGLRIDRNSEFFKDFQRRAAFSKIGKKRPDQSLVMKKLHAEGKLKKTEKQKEELRNRVKQWLFENGHPRGMAGKKHSDESLKKISIASKKNYENLTNQAKQEKIMKMIKTKIERGNLVLPRLKTTWKGGWREIGGVNKYYRSRWEANYARFLNWLKHQGKIKDWKHEPKTFWFEGIKRGCVSYLPDFWVEELDGTDSFHEVKGWMDDRSKTKIKRMAKYYPNVKLIVVGSKEYKEIENSLSSLIEGWEA